jgi:hypothetical protein
LPCQRLYRPYRRGPSGLFQSPGTTRARITGGCSNLGQWTGRCELGRSSPVGPAPTRPALHPASTAHSKAAPEALREERRVAIADTRARAVRVVDQRTVAAGTRNADAVADV